MRDARLVLPGVRAALEERSPAGHGHGLGDVSDLIPALENKAPLAHGHTLVDLPVAASSCRPDASTTASSTARPTCTRAPRLACGWASPPTRP